MSTNYTCSPFVASKTSYINISNVDQCTCPGQIQPRGDGDVDLIGESADNSDFLSRERALLGDDADQFATPNDNSATVEDVGDDDDDGEGDLLGGSSGGAGGAGAGDDMAGFESSFPAIDTSNEVCSPPTKAREKSSCGSCISRTLSC